jgi:hypothetical protein
MVSFRLVKEIRAPPSFVVDWWLDYSPDDPALTPGMVDRRVHRVDDRTVRLTTDTRFAGGVRTTDGTVTRTGPQGWVMVGRVLSNGVVVSTLRTAYTVEPTPTGSRVVADFEFEGKDLVWKLLIGVSRFSLRRDRNRAFDRYVVAIEKEFASPSAPSPGSANSSVAADRAPSA